jgi:hypothetical protein
MSVQYSTDYKMPEESGDDQKITYKIDDFIGIFENAFARDFCSDVIESIDKSIAMGLSQTRQQADGVPKIEKQDEQVFHEDYVNAMLFGRTHQYFMHIMESVVMPTYKGYYDVLSSSAPSYLHSVKLQRTEKGGGYHSWHYEQDGKACADRQMTFILYLNDIEEGGETEYLYQNRRVKPEAGKLVIWPASYTHTHRGNPPLTDCKYIMTGWYSF